MKRVAYALVAVAVLCAAGVAAIFAAPFASRASLQHSDADLAFRPQPGAQLPLGAALSDEDGRAVTLGEYFSKSPVILVLDYLRCTSLCGVTLRNIVDALDHLPLVSGRDYQLVAVSIDPRDTPADAAAAKVKYAPLLDRGAAGLHMLTGAAAASHKVADAAGFPYRYDRLLDAYIHPAGFVVATRDGVITRTIEGVGVSPAELVDALAHAQRREPQGLITRIVLLCHLQGAPLGRFTVPVLAAFMTAEIAAGLSALAIFVRIRRRCG
jgi:protein SCO1/2